MLQDASVVSGDRAQATEAGVVAALNAAAERIENLTRGLNRTPTDGRAGRKASNVIQLERLCSACVFPSWTLIAYLKPPLGHQRICCGKTYSPRNCLTPQPFSGYASSFIPLPYDRLCCIAATRCSCSPCGRSSM